MFLARPVGAGRVQGLLDAREQARVVAQGGSAAVASAYALLRLVIGVNAPMTAVCGTCGGPHGRPVLLDDSGRHVSVSHTAGLVAVAVSADGPVGVDVERPDATGFDGFAALALAAGEQADDDAARARLWTAKEAVRKATGEGLSTPLNALRLDRLGAGLHLLEVDAPAGWTCSAAVLAARSPVLYIGDGDALLAPL